MELNYKQEKKDMQGILLSGYPKLKASVYLLLKINSGEEESAKQYFNWLISEITCADFDDSKIKDAVNIAFTASGLRMLKLHPEIRKTFSRQFIEGMHSPGRNGKDNGERQILLGDRMENTLAGWKWGNRDNLADCVLMLYSENEKELNKLKQAVFDSKTRKGVTNIYTANTYENGLGKEHFGFSDGFSQPYIQDFKMPEGKFEQLSRNIVKAGEFILGYENEYGDYTPSPFFSKRDNEQENFDLPPLAGDSQSIDLGYNGSYLVFRQLEQHVEKFWKYQYDHSRESGNCQVQKAIKLAAKMVGRWPNGNSLVDSPDEEGAEIEDKNDFNYAVQDPDGIRCPFGAHIRRANPRDRVHIMKGIDNSIEMSNRHRMIRRGRIYGDPLVKDFDLPEMIQKSITDNDQLESGKSERGLHFICLVSDIQRQFEFVQNVWCNTSTFADLTDETDPIISPKKLSDESVADKFTVPHSPLRNRYGSLPQFVKVVGGAYFFLPGIRALKFICNG